MRSMLPVAESLFITGKKKYLNNMSYVSSDWWASLSFCSHDSVGAGGKQSCEQSIPEVLELKVSTPSKPSIRTICMCAAKHEYSL
jgi:hypothetical protein